MTNNLKWVDHLRNIRDNGDDVNCRGLPCTELVGCDISLDMDLPAITMRSRKVSYALLFAEAHWILSGGDLLADIKHWCPRMAEFSDDGIRLAGAYGPRFRGQVEYIKDTLIADPQSRQAAMTLFTPYPAPSKDIPCTLSIQFLIRNGYLHTLVNMRSSDAWLGLPYDIFTFTMMSHYIRLIIQPEFDSLVSIGMLSITMGSAHIYDRDRDKVDALLAGPKDIDNYQAMILDDLNHPDDLMAWLRDNRNDPTDFLILK